MVLSFSVALGYVVCFKNPIQVNLNALIIIILLFSSTISLCCHVEIVYSYYLIKQIAK